MYLIMANGSLVPRPSLSLSFAPTILEAGKKEFLLSFAPTILEAGKKELEILEAGKKELEIQILSFLPPKLLVQKKAREKAWERG